MSSVREELDSIYVFIARFDDGRKKDRIAFQTGDNRVDAEQELADDWYSKHDEGVSVDSLGSFPEFFTLSPKLNYDFKQNPNISQGLIDLIGQQTAEKVIEVAGSDQGWGELPPRRALDGDKSPEDTIQEKYSDQPPETDPERTLLTDKLVLFHDRLKRIVRNDFVEYDMLSKRTATKRGLNRDDLPVARALQTLTEHRHSCTSGDAELLVMGLILTEDGLPRLPGDLWTVQSNTDGEWWPTLAGHPEYDVVLVAHPDESRRKVQHRALNAIVRQRFESTQTEYEYDWYTVQIQDSELDADWALMYARSEEQAIRRTQQNASITDVVVASDAAQPFSTFKSMVRKGKRWTDADPVVLVDTGTDSPPDGFEDVLQVATESSDVVTV